jgi:Fe-S cluster assembly ATP-binding protein
MLEVKHLSVSSGKNIIVKDFSLKIGAGEIHVVMGPNGAGKSSVSLGLMGYPELNVKGSIKFEGKDISKSSADERARLGMFLAFQHPTEIEGLKISNFLRKAKGTRHKEKQTIDKMMADMQHLEETTKKVGLDELFIQRELNVGFSGGEKKRMEIVQMMELDPKLVILDEIDSGLDVDGIRLVADGIKEMQDGSRSFLIITHYPRLLRYLKPDFVHVMVKGKIVKTDGPELLKTLEEKGYNQFLKGA